METVACDFCGSAVASEVLLLHDQMLGLPGEYPLVRCDSCGLLYLQPRPTEADLADRYPDSYSPFHDKDPSQKGILHWVRQHGLGRRCRSVTSRKSGGRLLDIGCASGEFLNEMRRRRAWEVEGLEPAASAASIARNRFGLRVFPGKLLDAAYPDAHFDVVTMWNVLEHVPNPHSCLREVKRILRPGAMLVVSVPDPLSWQARLFGAAWAGFDAPRHLFGFPRPVLLGELATLGFWNISVQPQAAGYETFLSSLRYWLGARRRPQLASLSGRMGTSPICQVAGAPCFLILRMLGLASSLTYFATKPAQSGQAGGNG